MMKHRPRHLVEYAAVRVIGALANMLPYRSALCLGSLLAWPAFHIGRFRAKEAARRIRETFGNRFSMREAERVAWLSWRNFVLTHVEMLRAPRATREWLDSVAEWTPSMAALEDYCMSGRPACNAVATAGRGGIIATPHMGSWELAAIACRLYHIPLFCIAARQKNALVDAYAEGLRQQAGIETVFRGNDMIKQVMKRIRGGGMLAILPDVRAREESLKVRFLGREANVGFGAAVFARQCEVPIFVCILTRIGAGRHRIEMRRVVKPDTSVSKHEDWQRMTQEVFDTIEQAVTGAPEQWFWFNKRWIFDPAGADPAPAAGR